MARRLTNRSARHRRADPPRPRRPLRVYAAVAATALLGVGVAGCADSAALGLARQACHHVGESLTLYRNSLTQTDGRRAADDRARASAQLQAAAPLAAVAAGQDPQWQALMATLAENSRLPESDLTHALEQQCAAVGANGTSGPTLAPTTLPPPPARSN